MQQILLDNLCVHFYQVVKSDENDKAGVVISLRYSVGVFLDVASH